VADGFDELRSQAPAKAARPNRLGRRRFRRARSVLTGSSYFSTMSLARTTFALALDVTPLDEAHEHYRKRNDQQDVNGAAQRVGREEPEYPENH